MKGLSLHKSWMIGIVFISTILCAQEPIIETSEQKDLEFQTHFFEALKQTAINNYSKAIESLELSSGIYPTNVAVNFEFSKNYFALKKFNEASIFLEKAIEKEPANRFLLAHKVAILKAQQLFAKAIEIQNELVNINPKYKEDLVQLYIQNQQIDVAEKLISELEKSGGISSKIAGLKEFILQKRMVTEPTKKDVNTIVNSDLNSLKSEFSSKKEYKILLEILKQEIALNQFDLVVEDCKNGLELFPAQPYLYKTYALALNKLEKYNDAIAVLSIGIDFVFDDPTMEANFYEQFAISYTGLKKNAEAEKYKQKELKLRK